MNILIISPHVDDEIVGCGGTILKHRAAKDKISVLYIYKCWSGVVNKNKNDAEKIRKKEALKSAKILGISKQVFLRQDDRKFYLTNNIIELLIKAIRKIDPEIVYMPHPGESDREHRLTFEAAKEAIWLSNSSYLQHLGKNSSDIKKVFLYEVWSPLKNYDIKNDITKYIKDKILAIKQQKSQMKYFNLADASAGLNLYRGSLLSTKKTYAEVFKEMRI